MVAIITTSVTGMVARIFTITSTTLLACIFAITTRLYELL